MSDVSNSFSAWETLPEDEPPLCIAVRRPVSPPRHYEARERNPRTITNWDLFATLAGFWEDSAIYSIDDENKRFVENLPDCAKKAESFKTTKRRLSLETFELIRQRGAARTAGNQELTSKLAKLCREEIKEDLKGRRAEVLAEAAEAGKIYRPIYPSRLR
ncbi:hypothetical protein RB195_009086 [Necator americanus]|uniref:Uncharacterized protein n=1 Tax=Necator americanus TaxID=51031 RepID=A0ABR1CRP1_NECAM